MAACDERCAWLHKIDLSLESYKLAQDNRDTYLQWTRVMRTLQLLMLLMLNGVCTKCIISLRTWLHLSAKKRRITQEKRHSSYRVFSTACLVYQKFEWKPHKIPLAQSDIAILTHMHGFPRPTSRIYSITTRKLEEMILDQYNFGKDNWIQQ